MDITTDGLGFMLTFGCLSWIPFTFSLQARYLVFNPIDLGLLKSVGIISVNLVGLYIFRVSNLEKNNFRNGKNPKSMAFWFTDERMATDGWNRLEIFPN
jgi:Delta14-sterol reductase